MRSAGSIIDECGGTGEVASALALSDSTVSSWRTRPRGIPPEHWTALVKMASDRGKSEITLETLAALIARDPAEARA